MHQLLIIKSDPLDFTHRNSRQENAPEPPASFSAMCSSESKLTHGILLTLKMKVQVLALLVGGIWSQHVEVNIIEAEKIRGIRTVVSGRERLQIPFQQPRNRIKKEWGDRQASRRGLSGDAYIRKRTGRRTPGAAVTFPLLLVAQCPCKPESAYWAGAERSTTPRTASRIIPYAMTLLQPPHRTEPNRTPALDYSDSTSPTLLLLGS